ncbi:MAG TPA: hypothetical protein VFP72_17815 [Kineosporiaceae bacterium]|nr:hypothetical protein [Kineosporiaceae bacterium]
MDGDELRRLATRVTAVAEQARRVAVRAGGVSGVSWQSAAAEAFRARLAEEAHAVRGAAGEVDSVARALMRHAQAVEVACTPLVLPVAAAGVLAGRVWRATTEAGGPR